MSLFADYHMERAGRFTIESEDGFMIYSISGEECFICEFYIRPQSRRINASKFFFDKITEHATKENCTYFSCGVSVNAKNATEAVLYIIENGFKLDSANNNHIILTRELDYGDRK